MFIFKRKTGYYYISYKDINGKQKNVSTKKKTKNDALKVLSNVEKSLEEKQKSKVTTISLTKFRFEFLKHSEIIHTEKTNKVYKTTFKFFINYFGDIAIQSLTQNDIRNYLTNRFNTASVYMARKDLINLKACFNYAITQNYLLINPCKGIKQFRIPEKQPVFFSKEDFSTLTTSIDDTKFRCFVEIAANTGLRLNELLNLTWEQINFQDQFINLNNHNHITKSKRVRTIPLNSIAMNSLHNLLPYKKNNNVFHFDFGNEDYKVSNRFKHFVLKSGLDKKYHFHSLRHSFASWLVQSGVSIYIVSKLLGHADIKTTEIYSHLRTEDLRTALNSL